MSWPLSQDFNEAVQNPHLAFRDSDLKAATAVLGAAGLPMPHSGNFADVYQLRGADGRAWAVKCFTRPVVGLAERYGRVSAALKRADLPFTIDFEFLAEGILIGGTFFPAVKMEWVEGLLLNKVVGENADRPAVLAALGQMWVKLCRRLREAGIAHADIQHGNVLLVPGAKADTFGLKLIDYDGMHVPELADMPSGEAGHPSYQHPERTSKPIDSPDVDRFPHLVVATALAILEVGGAAFWKRYDTGDNLLFTAADFRHPARSALFKDAWALDNPKVRSLVARLAVACGRSISRTPWLDTLTAADGKVLPLDDETRAAAAKLGLVEAEQVSAVLVVKPPPVETREVEEPWMPFKPAERHKPKQIIARWPVVVAVCVTVIAVVIFVVSSRPKRGEPVPSKSDVVAGKIGTTASVPLPVPPIPSKDDTPIPVKPKEKEPDDPPPKPKAPPGKFLQAATLTPRWSVRADTDGVSAALHVDGDTQTVLLGSPRVSLMAFDLGAGVKRPGFFNFGLTGGDNFLPLNRGRVARFTADDADVQIWDAISGKPAGKIPVPHIPPGVGAATQKLARLSPDEKFLVVARTASMPGDSAEVPLRVFDTKSGKTILNITWMCGSVHFTPDSSRLLVAEWNGRFRWFKLPGGEPDGEFDLGLPAAGSVHAVTSVAIDGRVIAYRGPLIKGTDGAKPCLLDGRTGGVLRWFDKPYLETSPIALAADGRVAALVMEPAGKELTIEVVSVPRGEIIARATIAKTGASHTLALSADSRVLLVHDSKTATLHRFDLP